ncbi:MAG: S8 family serine peptidase [Chloroflexota bacterium]|nr:S8 family serine peptidase [Chloroflexota bacterium]
MKVKKVLRYVPLLLALAALVALPLLLWTTPAQGSPPAQPPFASGRILVKFKPQAGLAERAALHRTRGGQSIREIPGIEVEVVSIPAGSERGKAAAYARSPIVAYAEPDFVAYALGDPDDEHFLNQWGLDNEGQAYKDGQSGTMDADIDAPEAWDIITGTADIKIAILDTGIDQDHPDLDDKLADNIEFTDSETVDDLYGHGTHVAGIAAAETNNTEGVAGVGYSSSLLNVKVLNDDAIGYHSR